MKSLLVTNIKGGVAKSSTAAALAAGFKLLKPRAKVLLIDGDPQGSIKTYFGLKLPANDQDFSSFLIENTPFEASVQKVEVGGAEIDVAVSSRKLSEADVRMAGFHRREETLKSRFRKQSLNYDYCVIDSSPAMNLVLLNFMTFAESWIIPATMDAFAISNISYLFDQKRIMEEFYDRSPAILGILPTMFDQRTTIAKQALEAVKQKFGHECHIFQPIAMDTTVKKAQVKRRTIYEFAQSKAAQSYLDTTQKVLELI